MHRHRRSGAISGDFDAMGLGLFSSPPPFALSASSNQGLPLSDDLDRHFQFDNEKDFTNKPISSSFAFPSKSPDPSYPASPQHSCASPIRRPRPSSVLNSPIRMASQNRPQSQVNSPLTKFFMTEETSLDAQNVPDPLIDLDDVLHSNLHIGDQSTIGTPHDDFLASPFIKPNASPFVSSPLSVQNTTLFHQPIHEATADDIAEELEDKKGTRVSDDDCEIFAQAPNTLTDFYYNGSCNSSTSSLRSFSNSNKVTNQMIENTFSNGSKDSYNSGQNQLSSINTPPSKRSGAMANRYQSFYDQLYKISNALKVSSSESVNLTVSTSNDVATNDLKERTLGHLKSLQSLKSTSMKRKVAKGTLRFQDARVHYTPHLAMESTSMERPSVMLRLSSKTGLNSEKPLAPKPYAEPVEQTLRAHMEPLLASKLSSNSPSSLKSETSSTILSANSTVQSTDHSSLLSGGEYNKAKSWTSLNEEKPSKAPSIVVSTDCEQVPSPSTGSTCQQFPPNNVEDELAVSSRTSIIIDPSVEQTSPKKSPRRAASPIELSFLRSTQIPKYVPKDLTTRSQKIGHRKSKSMSLLLHRSFSAISNSSEVTALGSPEKRHRRFRDWFKKYND